MKFNNIKSYWILNSIPIDTCMPLIPRKLQTHFWKTSSTVQQNNLERNLSSSNGQFSDNWASHIHRKLVNRTHCDIFQIVSLHKNCLFKRYTEKSAARECTKWSRTQEKNLWIHYAVVTSFCERNTIRCWAWEREQVVVVSLESTSMYPPNAPQHQVGFILTPNTCLVHKYRYF